MEGLTLRTIRDVFRRLTVILTLSWGFAVALPAWAGTLTPGLEDALVSAGTISAKDLQLLHVVDTPEEVVQHVSTSHRTTRIQNSKEELS